MKKLFAIGTLLLSSAAVFAGPSATYNRNETNARFGTPYEARNEQVTAVRPVQVRDDWRVREERIERERREREMRLHYHDRVWDRY